MKPIFKPLFKSSSLTNNSSNLSKTDKKGVRKLNFGQKFTQNDSDLTQELPNFSNQESQKTNKAAQQKEIVTDNTQWIKDTLTEADYEDIFSSVLAKASAGLLSEPSEDDTKKNMSEKERKVHEENFKRKEQSVHVSKFIVHNEITPISSPSEARANGEKLLQAPVKKEKPKKDKTSSSSKIGGKENASKSGGKKNFSSNQGESKKKLKLRDNDVKKDNIKKKADFETRNVEQGVWVQCCKTNCLKWRYLSKCIDPTELPEFWTCSMNKDDKYRNNCMAAEADWSSNFDEIEDTFVYTDFNIGTIVWAQMPGYPHWPAMVDDDPDYDTFYESTEQGVVLRYHVVFLDKSVSRAWVAAKSIKPFSKNPDKLDTMKKSRYMVELNEAVQAAEDALKLSVEKRIQAYNFETRYFMNKDISKRWTYCTKKRSYEKKLKNKEECHVVPSMSREDNENDVIEISDEEEGDQIVSKSEKSLQSKLEENKTGSTTKLKKFIKEKVVEKKGEKMKLQKKVSNRKDKDELVRSPPSKKSKVFKPKFTAPSKAVKKHNEENAVVPNSDGSTSSSTEEETLNSINLVQLPSEDMAPTVHLDITTEFNSFQHGDLQELGFDDVSSKSWPNDQFEELPEIQL